MDYVGKKADYAGRAKLGRGVLPMISTRLMCLAAMMANGLVTLEALYAEGGMATAAEVRAMGFRPITSQELAIMLPSKDFELVNVHVPYEGEIAKTDTFIPFDKIGEAVDLLPADKATKIVVYCRSGRMSKIAAATLVGLGYTHVEELTGGMIDWEATGQPLIHR